MGERRRHRAAVARAVAVGLAGCLLGACQVPLLPRLGPGGDPTGASPDAPASAAPTPATAGPVVTGPGWTPQGGVENLPAPGSCHVRTAADGRDLPDPACTPGALDARVTAASIGSTICRAGGYTTTVRPPLSVSAPAKRAILLAYGIDPARSGDYELDHLVDLSDGGSSDGRNLWPERNVFRDATPDPYTHNDKDAVEATVHDAVCGGRVGLDAAGLALATDWTTALAVLRLR